MQALNHSQKISLKEKKKKYELAICTIFQNEAEYLKEWIEYHLLVGVQHFYLYNNLSTDNYIEVLRPYISNKVVTLTQWPFGTHSDGKNWSKIQKEAYNKCCKTNIGQVKWLAFIDTDEFIVPVQTDNIVTFLNEYDDFAGVAMNWQMYGTSHIKKIPMNKLMIETLLLKGLTKRTENLHIKSIVKPECVSSCSIHYCKLLPGCIQVDSNKKPCPGPKSTQICIDKIRLNHYWTRDENYLYNIKMPRRKKWKDNGTLKRANELNAEPDPAIIRFVPELRKRMSLDASNSI